MKTETFSPPVRNEDATPYSLFKPALQDCLCLLSEFRRSWSLDADQPPRTSHELLAHRLELRLLFCLLHSRTHLSTLELDTCLHRQRSLVQMLRGSRDLGSLLLPDTHL